MKKIFFLLVFILVVPLFAFESLLVSSQSNIDIFFFIFLGAILSLFVYSTFLYFSTKELDYLLFAIYLLFLWLWVSSSYGYLSGYITSSTIETILDILLLPISFIALIFFSIKFLNINKSHPKVLKSAVFICIMSTALFVINSVSNINTLFDTAIISFLILYTLYLGILSLLKGYAPSKFYLVAMGGYFLGTLSTFLSDYDLLPYTIFTTKAQMFGSIWQIIFLSLALGYKVRLLLNEKNQALLRNELQEKMLFLQSHYASIGELAGNITHQWREPLAEIGAVQTNLEASLLLKGSVSNEKLESSIKQNNEILKHLSETINTFYRFFKHQRVQKEEFDIVEEIHNLQKMSYYSLKVDKITLIYDCHDKITTLGNKSEFANAILNIILNAKDVLVERKIPDPFINITTYHDGKYIIITIEDNAGGIKQEPLEKIFESGVSSKEKSIGLGLYITKAIIEQKMGGEIKVKNFSNGAMFKIILPVVSQELPKDTQNPNYNLEESTLQRISRLEREVAKQSEIEKTLNQWEEIFNQAHWGIALHKGKSLKFEMVNPAFLKMYGYKQEEIKQIDVTNIIAPQSLDILDQNMKKAFEKSFLSTEILHIKKDGTVFPVNVDITVIKNENYEVLYYIANVRDITKQKETQQELLLKTFALNHVHEAIYLVGEQSQIYDINEGACRALGYTKEELLELHITDIDPEWPKERWSEHWRELKEKKTITVETHHLRKDGTIFPVEVEANYFEYNGVGYNLGLVRDISERKEIEKRKEDEKMRLFFEKQLVGMAITSPDKRWLHTNEKLSQILGYSFDELQTMKWSDITHPDDLDKSFIQFDKMITGEIDDYIMEKRFIRKDGNIIFTNLSVSCVRDEKDTVEYIIAVIEDISKRKLFEMALKEKNSHYNSILENATDVMYLVEVTEDGRFIHKDINKAYLEVSGLQKEDVIDKYVDEFENKEYKDILTHKYTACLKAGKLTHYTREYHFPAGKMIFHSTLSPIYNEDGRIYQIFGVARDITKSKKEEEEIKALNTTLEQKVKERTKELAEKEREVRTLAENMPDFLARYDKECRRIYVNKAVTDYFDVASKEVLGTTPEDKPLHGVPKEFQEKVYYVLNNKKSTELESYNDLKGKRQWWNVIFTPEFNENGDVESVLSIAHDITNLKKAEFELKEREEKFSQLFQSSPAAVSVSSLDKNIYLDVNDSFVFYTQYTKEEAIGKGARELNIFANPDDRERYLEKLFKDGFIRDFEFEYQTKDGTTGYALAYASILDIKGEKCVLTHSYPINARKQLELITTAINSASEAIYIISSSSHLIMYVNDAACDMLGYTKEELLSMKVQDIDAIQQDVDLQNFENQANQGEKFTIETQHKRKDGTIIDVEVKVSAFQFGGKDIGISVVKDITEFKKTHLALQKKQKEFTEQLEHKVKQRTKELEKALKFNEDIINAIPDLMFEISKEGIYLNIWTRDETLLAEQKEFLLGKNLKDVLPPDVVEVAFKTMQEVDNYGSSLGNTYTLELPDGKHLFELHITKKEPEETYLALSRDITKRYIT